MLQRLKTNKALGPVMLWLLLLFARGTGLWLHHHDPAVSLLRQLYRFADGIHGTGHPGSADAQLQICGGGNCPHHRRLLWTGNSGAFDRHHQRTAADAEGMQKDLTDILQIPPFGFYKRGVG